MTHHHTNALLASLNVVPSIGGPYKTMGYFKRALNADIISFTDMGNTKIAEQANLSQNLHVPICNNRFGRAYFWTSGKNLNKCHDLLKQAQLLSCHMLFRYHAQWVEQMSRRYSIPYLVVPHGGLDPYVFSYNKLQKRIWMKLYGERLLKNAACVIFSTKKEQEKASSIYQGANTRTLFWPIEPFNIDRKPIHRKKLRDRLGCKENDRILLFLGRLHPMKNVLETIEAVARACSRNLHLVIVGPEQAISLGKEEGISHKDCIKTAQKHGFANLHLMGSAYGEDKEEYFCGADGFISLSQRENFGHTVAEALSAELPVILSPGNDLADDFKHTGCGWFLEKNTIPQAIDAINQFMRASDEALKIMGAQGRKWALGNLTYEHFAEQLNSIIQSIVSKSKFPKEIH